MSDTPIFDSVLAEFPGIQLGGTWQYRPKPSRPTPLILAKKKTKK